MYEVQPKQHSIQTILARAEEVLDAARMDDVQKTMWASPAGKKRIAARLVKLLPPHRTYVEPFAGSAAVFFEKEPSEVEVLSDLDADIAEAYHLIQKLNPSKIKKLRALSWKGDKGTFEKLKHKKPRTEVDKLYRFLYLRHFSYGKLGKGSFDPGAQGTEAHTVKRLERFYPRLQKTNIYGGDYEKIIQKYDGKDTLFFLDPPYAGYDAEVGEKAFDEERFFETLKSIQGKWLLTYGTRGKLPSMLRGAGFKVRQIRTPRSIRTMQGVEGPKMLTQLLVSNFDIVTKNEGEEDAPWLHDGCSPLEEEHVESEKKLLFESSSCAFIKGIRPDDERYVLGIVLEPETVDAQGDIYSAAEIQSAAHRFMEDFGKLGLMHQTEVSGQVKILESYLAPCDFSMGDTQVRKGAWLMATRVLSDALWQQIKEGTLSGFSIGGSARSVEEPRKSHLVSKEEEAA